MDSALELRMLHDSGQHVAASYALQCLQDSSLVRQLTSNEPLETSLSKVWRLVACSEIPFIERLPYTQRLMAHVVDTMWTGSAFSLDGTDAAVLPCYHAMILRSLLKLGFEDSALLDKGIDWILRFQPFARNARSDWTGSGIKKYGGCFRATPCYIGLAKSTKALLTYQSIKPTQAVQQTIDNALEYLLNHKLIYRLSKNEPITRHILDLSFPESYQLNIVELLMLIYEAGRIDDPRVAEALQYVNAKRLREGYWKTNYVYQAKGYIPFDKRGIPAEWLTYLLNNIKPTVPI